MVNSEVYRRIAEDKGVNETARGVVRPPLERIDFLAATRRDLEAMRREIYPLAQRLATRLTVDHHHGRRGAVDFRRTIRASLSTGGVPLDLRRRPRRPRRSEVVILCDTSTSVAPFARFALALIYALREQFTLARAANFIDPVDEITDAIAPGTDIVEEMERLNERADRPWIRGGTNYGRAFEHFTRQHSDAIGPRTCVLILGDGRANYLDPGVSTLRALVGPARRAYWLNPEPSTNWGSGDSAAPSYAEAVPMSECRNLAQLGEWVHQLAV